MENVILIRHRKDWKLSEKLVDDLSQKALDYWGYKEGVELSVVFVGRKKAKELNIRYRQMDYVPQVLGFPMSRQANADGMIRLGDVVICTCKLNDEIIYQKSSKEVILFDWLKHGIGNLLKD